MAQRTSRWLAWQRPLLLASGEAEQMLHRVSGSAASLSLALSLALHGGLLALVSSILLRSDAGTEIIRISLVNGGGRGIMPAGGSGATAVPSRLAFEPTSALASAATIGPPEQGVREVPPVATRATAVHRRPRATRAGRQAGERILPAKSPPSAGELQSERPARVEAADAGATAAAAPDGAARRTRAGGAEDGSGRRSGPGPGTGVGVGLGPGSGPGAGDSNDLRAYCLSCPKPQYPRIARVRGWQGTVGIDVEVRADGSVRQAQVSLPSGHDALDSAALAVARRSRFHLASPNGRHGIRGRIAYAFKLVKPRR